MFNKKLFLKLSRVQYFFWSTLWLMVLVVLGTLAQNDQGLYLAQNTYFSSWFVWWGFIPLPGGTPTMGIIFFGLLSQLIFKTHFSQKKLGIAITHLGAFLLLLGGLLTGLFSFEGNMVIPEGQSASYFQDYHKLELAVVNTDARDHDVTTTFDQGWFGPGKSLTHESLPFTFTILKFCANCSFERRTLTGEQKNNYVGFAQNFSISALPLAKEDGENRAGIEFQITGSDHDGIYSVIEAMPIRQSLNAKDGRKYYIEIRHKRYNLPFTIKLFDFEKKVHAATQQAKSYKSVVSLIDGDLTQRAVIQMNEPLRYKGYTLYQASFIESNDGETTVLAVVKNVGRLFPYISSIIICIGLLIHLLQNLPTLFKKRS